MITKPIAMLLAVALCGGGCILAAVAIAAIPLGLGGDGFGYKKLLVLLIGLESAGCGALLWHRLRGSQRVSTAVGVEAGSGD